MAEPEAGRALDAQIAEQVMGWTHEPDTDAYFVLADWLASEGKWRTLPHFSTDMAAAWQVVEHLQSGPEGWKYTLHLVAHPYGRTYAYFGLDRPDDADYAEGHHRYNDDDQRIAHATPLAICRAALLAVGA